MSDHHFYINRGITTPLGVNTNIAPAKDTRTMDATQMRSTSMPDTVMQQKIYFTKLNTYTRQLHLPGEYSNVSPMKGGGHMKSILAADKQYSTMNEY